MKTNGVYAAVLFYTKNSIIFFVYRVKRWHLDYRFKSKNIQNKRFNFSKTGLKS